MASNRAQLDDPQTVVSPDVNGSIPILSAILLVLLLSGIATFLAPSWAGAARFFPGLLFSASLCFGIWLLTRGPRIRLRHFLRPAPLPLEPILVFSLAVLLLLPAVWTYSLIDPWEGHYAEVARRMLADSDWVHLKFQNEIFRSKPVLIFWMIAASLRFFGFAEEGGFSGELAGSDLVVFAVRLPFIIFGAVGVAFIWWALARLLSRRTAWLFFVVCLTSAFFSSIARSAITDMPMVACTMIAIACFAMTIEFGRQAVPQAAVRVRWWSWTGSRSAMLFGVLLLLVVGGQVAYFGAYFVSTPMARGIALPLHPSVFLVAPLLIAVFGLWLSTLKYPVHRTGQVWMFWFYFAVGVGVLAKGPPTLAIAGVTCLAYLTFTWRWNLLKELEIPRGVVITTIVALPWHVAMWLRDGPAFVTQYVNYHMLVRFTDGAHGDRGTFEYFFHQLGIGMWPWSGLVIVGLGVVVVRDRRKPEHSRAELLFGIWLIATALIFGLATTKFHHYIFPAVPGCAVLVAILLDRLCKGGRVAYGGLLVAASVTALLTWELVGEQKKIVELYVYRHDRPWPSGEPWNIDLSASIMIFGIAFTVLFLGLAWTRVRRVVVGAVLVLSLLWLGWVEIAYSPVAGKHWGQRDLHRTYYSERNIRGLNVKFFGLRELHESWRRSKDRFTVKTTLPRAIEVGTPSTVTLEIPNLGLPDNKLQLDASISRLGDSEVEFQLSAAAADTLAYWAKTGESVRPTRAPVSWVAADRLIAWRLEWKGENFWSAGEIWGPAAEVRTVFEHTNSVEFGAYLRRPEASGRTYFLITQSGLVGGLKALIPTREGKQTLEIVDSSNNKFTLVRFSL